MIFASDRGEEKKLAEDLATLGEKNSGRLIYAIFFAFINYNPLFVGEVNC